MKGIPLESLPMVNRPLNILLSIVSPDENQYGNVDVARGAGRVRNDRNALEGRQIGTDEVTNNHPYLLLAVYLSM